MFYIKFKTKRDKDFENSKHHSYCTKVLRREKIKEEVHNKNFKKKKKCKLLHFKTCEIPITSQDLQLILLSYFSFGSVL